MNSRPTLLRLAALIISSSFQFVAADPVNPSSQRSSDGAPSGIAKSDWGSIRAAYDAGRHAFEKTEDGWQAHNPGQQWRTKFDGRGFVAEPKGGGWTWGLELKSYGFPGKERAVGGIPTVQASGQRLTYQWDESVQEWFVNDGRGLEHGFTVKERPEEISNLKSRISNPLAFTLAVRGGLRPVITADSLGVNFQDSKGATVLTYAGLKVWDADGKILPSHFTSAETGVRLLVDERGARYPIIIDPIAQQAYVKASNSGDGDEFGFSVAISGNTVVVGAPDEEGSGVGVNPPSNNLALGAGAAYVFVRSGATWTQQAYLKASNTGAGDAFGSKVAISGDTVVVGAPLEDGSGNKVDPISDELEVNAGAAYVFFRVGATWAQQAYLKASASGSDDYFGGSVAVSGDTVVVGATGEDGSGTGVNPSFNNAMAGAGAAYVYVRSGATWNSEAYLKASNTGANDTFGISVAISGDTVVIGARLEDGGGTGINSADNNLATDSGMAYVFTRSGGTWSQEVSLKASTVGFYLFGNSVAVSGDTVVVGTLLADAVYVFQRSGATWSQQAMLTASNAHFDDEFGTSVAISGDTVVVGAYAEDGSGIGVDPVSDNLAFDAGAAYVFVRLGGTWSQQAYLKASNTGIADNFGSAVAVSDDTVIVGAYNEDGSGNGVNPGSNELGSGAGAAYIFAGLGTLFPEIVVQRGALLIPSGGSQAFGAVNVGGSTDLTFDLRNTGLVNLTLTGAPNKVTVSGPDAAMFSVVTQPTSPVGPHANTLFTARFTPTSAGTKTARLPSSMMMPTRAPSPSPSPVPSCRRRSTCRRPP